ncbi:hypothetical protein P1J78_22250 [Psychromarinibacter sp. C21-152]|uniref:Uncharacterized protein n=1 Tax=Psychromarinibacter sediminicola TaxID=3033385 RepID=A0AAE3TAP6_9RHOB|nr:hypothetical protein [Psychromarinibacter sediminicola]MDF0603457.1 hypothetical protein [Psychromarinibacter sediminicola]
MTDTATFDPSQFRRAYGETESKLNVLSGLTYALYELASESNRINVPDDDANAILSLILAVEEHSKQLCALHEQEWQVVIQGRAPIPQDAA